MVTAGLIVSVVPASAQSPDVPTDPGRTRLHAIGELPFPEVRDVAQDDQSFIWFGVGHHIQGGLVRYDGLEIKRYTNDPNDPNSLSHNAVHVTYVDNDGILWVGTNRGGLNRYNADTDDFTPYLHDPGDATSLPDDDIKVILQASDGTHWIGTSGGLARLNVATGEFDTFAHEPDNPDSLPNSVVRTIAEDQATGELWVGTSAGLSVFDPDEGSFRNYRSDDSSGLSDERIESLLQDSEGRWWVGTSDGLNRYDPDQNDFTRFFHDPEDPSTIGDSAVLNLLEDRYGRLWIGHGTGLDLWDPETGTTVPFVDRSTYDEVLGSSQILALFEDRQGAIWIGTRQHGAARISPFATNIEYFRHDPADPTSLNSDFVARLDATDEGIWVVTDVGVDFFDGTEFTDYTEDLGLDGGWPGIFGVLGSDDGNTVWLGTNDGRLIQVDLDTGERQEFNVPAPADKTRIWPVAAAADGGVWFTAPWGYGVGVLRPTGDIELLIDDGVDDDGPEQVYAFSSSTYFDAEAQHLWVTGLGLARFDVTNQEVEVFSYDAENPGSVVNQLWSVDRRDDGSLWLASSNGVHEFDPVNGEFVELHYEPLPSPGSTDARFGPDGRLWVVSGPTLAGYDPTTGETVVPSVDHETAATSHITEGNWVSSKFVLGPDDVMYAPTLDRGLVKFDPLSLSHNDEPPRVALTGFSIDGLAVDVDDNGGITPAVNRSERFELAHDQDTFSIEFAALNFEHPELNRYRYQLEGFDSDWHYVGADKRFASYTNVPPGDYTFRVQASNNSDVWSPDGLSVVISVAMPWYETGWARGAAVLALLALIVVVFRWRTRRQRERTRELEQQLVERARHYEERGQLLAAVQQQSDRLQGILAAAPIGVVLLNPDLEIIVKNRFAVNEIPGLSVVSPQGQLEMVAGVPVSELLANDGTDAWITTRWGTGSDRYVISMSVRSLDTRDGQPQGWVLLWDDETDLHALEDRQATQDRLAAVGQFAAGIAHDVNNLLTVIGLNAEMLEHDSGLNDEHRRRVGHIVSRTGAASRIMTQILDYSRQGTLVEEVVDLHQLVSGQIGELIEVINPGVQIEYHGQEPAFVRADPTQLERLLHNLVLNANDAVGERGTIRVAVDRTTGRPPVDESHASLSAEAEYGDNQQDDDQQDWVTLTVADDGAGIDSEVLPTIFEPFVTTKAAGHGSGLGLAQVAGIAAEHSGTVTVETEPGNGTSFCLMLPAAEVTEHASDRVPVLAGSSRRGEAQRVLIVDDDEEILSLLEELFIDRGYRVVTANDGRAALGVWEQHQPAIDLVLTDLAMPEMDGWELLDRLDDRGAGLPVIVMSALAPRVPKNSNVVAMLQKPIDSEQLFSEVAGALTGSRA